MSAILNLLKRKFDRKKRLFKTIYDDKLSKKENKTTAYFLRPWESVVFTTGTIKCPSANHLDVNKTLPSDQLFGSLPMRQVFHKEDFNNRLHFLTTKLSVFDKTAWTMF